MAPGNLDKSGIILAVAIGVVCIISIVILLWKG